MKIYKTSKRAISFQNNPIEFLNGLTSNDMDKPNNAFLNIHGKIIATFDQIKINDEEMVVLIEEPFVQEVLSHLDKYIKLGGIKVEELS